MDFDLSVSERTLDVSMGEETLTGTVVLGRLHPENPVRAAAAPIASCCGALSKWHSASTVRRCQIHDLKGVDCTDGGFPAGLILASDGNFYGTTQIGGANNYGTVFQMTAAGMLTTLYSFCSQTN